MASRDLLADFVGTALAQGRGRTEIRRALLDAGWAEAEVADALEAWADLVFTPPVPRPRPTVSAQDFFIYALITISLAVAAFNLVDLAHQLIDILTRDPDDDVVPRTPTWELAALLVFGGVYSWLSRTETARRRADPARQRSAIRKWTVAVILLATVLTLMSTLVWGVYLVIDTGGADPALLKVAVTAAVAAGIWWAYRGTAEA
jgi:uncharacterized membrane protein